MRRHVLILLLLPLLAVSCASSNHTTGEQDSADEKPEQDIPPPVRQIRSFHVQEVRRYLWSSDEVTLHFLTTNYFEGARVSLLTTFPKTAKIERAVYLRLSGAHWPDYQLTLGSAFCRDLAASLTFSDPSVVLYSNRFDRFDNLLIPERVGKLRELLRGSYTYKSPPP